MSSRDVARTVLGLSVVLAFAAVPVALAQTPVEIDAALKAAYEKYKGLQEGANADYIPALATVDPKIYGIALVTVDGKVYTAGDVTSEVSIQSISKVCPGPHPQPVRGDLLDRCRTNPCS